jgi:hypothetical protein
VGVEGEQEVGVQDLDDRDRALVGVELSAGHRMQISVAYAVQAPFGGL